MCFGCHFNICARHARGAEGSAAGGKETLAIVTETSIWATRVLATGGDQKKGDLAKLGDQKKGDLVTSDQKKGNPAISDQKMWELATYDQMKGEVGEYRSLLPDVDQDQLKAALSLEAMLPGIFPGKASILVEEKKEESVVNSKTCHSESHISEEGKESNVEKSAEVALPEYYPATNLPKNSVVDIV